MPLSGDTSSFSLTTLYQMLDSDQKTGVLTLSDGVTERRVFFHEGSIVFMVSDDPRDMLGHFLVSKGLITEEEQAKALQIHTNGSGLLGDVITRITELSEEKIKEQVYVKLKESLYQLFLLEDQQFSFEEIEQDLTQFPDFKPVPVRSILMEAIKRIDEFKKLREKFPHNFIELYVDEEKVSEEIKKNQTLGVMVDQLKEGKSIEDLCLAFHTYEYPILKNLSILLRKKVIEVIDPELPEEIEDEDPSQAIPIPDSFPTPPAPPDFSVEIEVEVEIEEESDETTPAVQVEEEDPIEQVLAIASDLMGEGNFLKAYEIALDISKISKDSKVQNMLGECEKKIEQEIQSSLPGEAILELPENLDYTAKEVTTLDSFIMSRINGVWSVGEIVSILPVPEVESKRSLLRLLKQGMISVKPKKK